MSPNKFFQRLYVAVTIAAVIVVSLDILVWRP